jgi:hypothetical protein
MGMVVHQSSSLLTVAGTNEFTISSVGSAHLGWRMVAQGPVICARSSMYLCSAGRRLIGHQAHIQPLGVRYVVCSNAVCVRRAALA